MAKKHKKKSIVHNVEHTSKHKQTHSKKKTKKSIIAPLAALAAIVVIILIVIFSNRIFTPKGGVVAVINGEKVYSEEVDWRYERAAAQSPVEKEDVLNQLVTEKVLLQEAKKQGIEVTDDYVNSEINMLLMQSGLTEKDLIENLKEQGITSNDFKDMYKNQVIIGLLLDEVLLPEEILESEILGYYNDYKDFIEESYEDVKSQIELFLEQEKQYLQMEIYIENLMEQYDVQTFPEKLTKGTSYDISASTGVTGATTYGTFRETGNEICTQDKKPVIRLYSTTWCPHCSWIKETFDNVAKEYINAGKIVAYHWELDINDDSLTPVKESSIPTDEAMLFQTYNPQGGVPTFIFGCKYLRIGNGYQDLKLEEAEFRSVIESLIEATQ